MSGDGRRTGARDVLIVLMAGGLALGGLVLAAVLAVSALLKPPAGGPDDPGVADDPIGPPPPATAGEYAEPTPAERADLDAFFGRLGDIARRSDQPAAEAVIDGRLLAAAADHGGMFAGLPAAREPGFLDRAAAAYAREASGVFFREHGPAVTSSRRPGRTPPAP